MESKFRQQLDSRQLREQALEAEVDSQVLAQQQGNKQPFRVLVVFGTRPETIKMAPLVRELQSRPQLDCQVCVTAQHRQMLDQMLKVYGIQPDYDLNIMQAGQSLSDITARVLRGLQEVFEHSQPDLVCVHGDTTTAFAAALAAFYARIPLAHIEAGLRTYDKYSPYPEEMNRQLLSRLVDLHFAPTESAVEHLRQEGIPSEHIFLTGNTAIDALHWSLAHAQASLALSQLLEKHRGKRLLLLTAHRRENLGQPMLEMFRALRRLLEEKKDLALVYPLHLNPKVRELAREVFDGREEVSLIEPLDVFDFHLLMQAAHLILTDSGGIQEEAPSIGKPILVLRRTTERPEGLAAGTALLVGHQEEEVYRQTRRLLEDEVRYQEMAQAKNPYGDGQAARRIVDALLAYLLAEHQKQTLEQT